MRYLLVVFFSFVFIHPAYADCISPAGAESATRYDFTAHKLYYCDGTNWVELGGAAGIGGALESTYLTCSNGVANCTVTCAAGWVRTGCRSNATPAGVAGCTGIGAGVYCVRLD